MMQFTTNGKDEKVSSKSFAFTLSRSCRVLELHGGGEFNSLVQSPIERALHSIDTVRPLNRFPDIFRSHKVHSHMDATDDKYTVLGFHFSGYICRQAPIAGIDLARFQRTPKGTEHSTSGCRDDVIQR
jgi:hypothetical protein